MNNSNQLAWAREFVKTWDESHGSGAYTVRAIDLALYQLAKAIIADAEAP